MFKSHELVVKMEKTPKKVDGQTEMSQPRSRFDALDVQMTSERFARDIARAYLIIKGFKTLCGMLEHIVVTKVK